MSEIQSCLEFKKVGANLDKNHPVFNLIYLVELFFLFFDEESLRKNKNSTKSSKYTLKELLTFVLWGRENNKLSSRELADWCNNNDETCKLVLNSKKPSKSTINNFLNEYAFLFDLFDQFLVDFAMALGLISAEILYGDGTILKAWCNGFKKMYPYEIRYLKEFLLANSSNEELWFKLKRYFIHEDDDEKLKEELTDILNELKYNLNAHGLHLLKLGLKSSKDFNKILERIKLMEKNIDGENSISIIDPESRHMPDKDGKMGLNYNYQTVTDNKYGFRVAHYLTNSSNDEKELYNMVKLTTERIHSDNYILCVDYGYWNPELLKKVYQTNTRIVIPDKADATRKKKKIQNKNRSIKRQKIIESKNQEKNKKKNKPKRLKKHEFTYDAKNDTFECPKTKKLLKIVDIVKITGVDKKKYSCDYCPICEFKPECTSQNKRIFYERYDKDIESIRKLYYSDKGQQIYYQRGHYAETSFAILLESRNFRGIKTRSLKKANNELTIWEIHHNIKKFQKHTTNKFLKLLKNKLKKQTETEETIDFSLIKKIKDKLIIKNDVIKGIRDD